MVPQFDVFYPRLVPRPAPAPPVAAPRAAAPTQVPDEGGEDKSAVSARSGRTRTRNCYRDERFNGNTPLGRHIRNTYIREALAIKPAPLITTGSPFCLTWHLKGTCLTNCTRASNHIQLGEDNKGILYVWCKVAYPEPS